MSLKNNQSDVLFIIASGLLMIGAIGTSFGIGYLLGTSQVPEGSVDLGNGVVVENIEIDAEDPFLGDEDAPVTVVEFSDYECPYCARHYSQSFDKLVEEYVETGQVKLVFKDLPLESIHPNATKAAVIAECAYDQGGNEAYFAVHNRIFDNMVAQTGGLSEENVFSWIADTDLNIEELRACADENRTIDRVSKDAQQAMSLGVQGTPGIFVNGKFFNGAYPYQDIKNAIDAELAQ